MEEKDERKEERRSGVFFREENSRSTDASNHVRALKHSHAYWRGIRGFFFLLLSPPEQVERLVECCLTGTGTLQSREVGFTIS